MSIPFKVYLAGPINGLTYEGAVSWRDYAAMKLAPEIEAYSPLRGKEFLQDQIKVFGRPIESHPLLSTRGIMVRDLYDVQSSDAILVNLLGAKKSSYGSVYELAWSFQATKQIVLVIESEEEIIDMAHDHEWITKGTTPFTVDNLDFGIAIIKSILLSNPGVTTLGFTGA